ncbi:uncharacterized protein LOC130196751 isoform X2 [Pseudoliparis swirei]|uniref:uncharacterized protein LOC130196751 isoform X2 n=1 Tax=Pseudoliparis swirei TaxID=2059687 RepID=UPI0024BE5449|nr:uncharacterized protein LOC130196751 isoform X2 [Pseudoliparis swirei]
MMFHLIEFLDSKTVAVVPQSWYGCGDCVWPNYPRDERVDKAVRSAEEPQPGWQTHDVRIIRSCDDYLVARRWMKKYMSYDTSDLRSEEEAIPKKRKPMPVHFYGDSDENRPPKKTKGQTTSGTVAPPPPIPRTSSPAGQRTSQGYTPTWRGARCGSDAIAFCAAQIQILGMLQTLTQQVQQLTGKVDSLVRPSVTQMSVQEVEWRDPFPLTTMEEVDLFEQQLKDPANILMKKSVISSLGTIGGHDVKRATWNILARMFSDDVGKSINWKGINGKKSFNQMMSKTLLLHAVRKNHSTHASTDDQVLKHAMRWFNLATDRGCSMRRATVDVPH